MSLDHHICNLDKFRFTPCVDNYQYEQSITLMKLLFLFLVFITAGLGIFIFLPNNESIQYKDSLDNKLYSIAIDKDGMFVASDHHAFFKHPNQFSYDVFVERFVPTSEYPGFPRNLLFLLIFCYVVLFVVALVASSDSIKSIWYERRARKAFANLKGIYQ